MIPYLPPPPPLPRQRPPHRKGSRRPSAASSTPPPVPPRPQELHSALVHDLSRPIPGAPGVGVVGTIIAAVTTFGLLPLVLWVLRFGLFARSEREQYQLVAEWVRLNTRHPAADALARRAARVGSRAVLSLVSLGCAVVLIGVVVMHLIGSGPFAGTNPLGCTYRPVADLVDFLPAGLGGNAGPSGTVDVHQTISDAWTANARPTGIGRLANANAPQIIFLVWTGLLSLGYLAHWLNVHLHARSVRRFLDEFNKVAVHDALAPVFLAPVGTGVRPLWTLGSVGLVLIGALWGIPATLAGAVQRRYTHKAAPAARGAVAARLRHMMAIRRPVAGPAAPPPPPPRVKCETAGCRLPLPAGARFCPRCGGRSVPPLDRLA